MKRALVLLALLVAAASFAVGDSSAVVGTASVSLTESSSYAYASGTTLYYSAASGSFTVTATDSNPSTIASVDFPSIAGMTGGGTDSTAPFETTYSFTSSTSASGSQTVTVKDSDLSSGTATFTVTPDTGPTVSNVTATEVTGAGDQYWASSANTLWFRSAGAGSFTLSATAADVESGIGQVAFPDVSGTSGWAGSNGGADTGSPYASPVAYTWTAGAAAPGAKQVTATNGTGMTATATVTIGSDATPPSGQTVALSGGPWYTSASVPLTIGSGTDAASGVDSTRGIVERAAATLTNGTCATFGTFAAVTLSGGADTGVSSANCYRYQYKATDNVGNVSTASAASADAKVDTTPPTVPSLFFSGLSGSAAAGTTVYYRSQGAGSFTVTAAASDAESGVSMYAFPSIPGFTMLGSGASRTYSFSSAPSSPPGALSITATNSAGQTSAAATFTLVPDSTLPVVTIRCNGKPCLASTYANAVTVTLSASDGSGSGIETIRYTTDGTDPTPGHGSEYDKPFSVGSLVHLRVRAYDKAGNASAPARATIRSLADLVVFRAPTRVTVKAKARYLQARVSSNRRARATAVLRGKGLKRPARWHFLLPSGGSIVQLRLPVTIKRPGVYTLAWSLTTGTHTARKTTRVVLAGR